jgi:hypothetical protein
MTNLLNSYRKSEIDLIVLALLKENRIQEAQQLLSDWHNTKYRK